MALIQSGTSADKTFLDNFWSAHTCALAMADVQTGQVISDRCYLNWPLTDKEREAGEYSNRFAKGKVYRIKVRGWKGTALNEPQWYVTEVLEEDVSCPALDDIWAEYIKPIVKSPSKLDSIEVSDRNIGDFLKTARKYDVDFALKRDKSTEPPTYHVFFSAAKTEDFKRAFSEYVGKGQGKTQKRGEFTREQMHQQAQKIRNKPRKQKQREKTRENRR